MSESTSALLRFSVVFLLVAVVIVLAFWNGYRTGKSESVCFKGIRSQYEIDFDRRIALLQNEIMSLVSLIMGYPGGDILIWYLSRRESEFHERQSPVMEGIPKSGIEVLDIEKERIVFIRILPLLKALNERITMYRRSISSRVAAESRREPSK